MLPSHQGPPYFRLGIELPLDDDLVDISFLVVVELILSLCELASRGVFYIVIAVFLDEGGIDERGLVLGLGLGFVEIEEMGGGLLDGDGDLVGGYQVSHCGLGILIN